MFAKIRKPIWKLTAVLLLLTGCTSQITPTIDITDTALSTVTSVDPYPLSTSTMASQLYPAPQMATSAKPTLPTVKPTETAPPTITPTETTRVTDTPSPGELLPLPDPLLAVAHIYKETLIIKCVETGCIRRIFLGGAAPIEQPYRLGAVYCLNPESMFITMYSTDIDIHHGAVLQINPATGEVNAIELPFTIKGGMIAHGKLLMQDSEAGRIHIIQDNASILRVELGTEIFQLIEADDYQVIAVNDQPIEQDGATFVETFVIDVRSGEFCRKLVKSPAFANWFNHPEGVSTEDQLAAYLMTVSTDLEYVYLYYNRKNGDEFHKILGKFNTASLEEVSAVIDPEYLRIATDDRLYSCQYRNVSYPRVVPKGGEYAPQGVFAPIDLSTLESLIDPVGGSRIAPFGDHFAIGTRDKVILVSLDGNSITEYPLPYTGGLTYRLVEYKK